MTGKCGIRTLSSCALALFLFGILLAAAAAQNAAAGFAPIASALQNGEFQKALELLRPALQASPRNAQLWAMQGAAYAGEGHPKEALGSFRSALKISPDYLPALQGAIQIEYEAAGRGCDSTLAACAALATCRCHQSWHARGARISTRKLWRSRRSF